MAQCRSSSLSAPGVGQGRKHNAFRGPLLTAILLFIFVVSQQFCSARELDLTGSPGPSRFLKASVGQFWIACTCFSSTLVSPSFLCSSHALLVCKATSSTSSSQEPILKFNGVLHWCDHGLSDGPRHFGQFFLRVTSRLLVMSFDFACASLLCSACWYTSACPSLAVPASWRKNRDLCVSQSFHYCCVRDFLSQRPVFLPGVFVSCSRSPLSCHCSIFHVRLSERSRTP